MYSADIQNASKMLSQASKIALIGNGGNMAVAQHMASDIYRHTGKFCFAPDSINLTALGGDNDWKEPWIDYACQSADLISTYFCIGKC
jgi:phosphoheptose isomerase